jgi:negative regulator of flagellin synthesis FlgM
MVDTAIRNQGATVRGAQGAPQAEGAKTEKISRQKDAANAYAKNANEAPSVKNAAQVNISPKAREMSMAKKAVDEAPDVRESKITEMKQKIKNGYKADPEKIADGIAREAMRDDLAESSRV